MKRKSIYQFIKDNYVLEFTVQGELNGCSRKHPYLYKDAPVNVYRPKMMNPLPEKMKEYAKDTASIGGYSDAGGYRWYAHNPDYGMWDAFCVFKYHPDRTDVYVCSILRRPWTDDQQKFYEKNCAFIAAPYRIYAPWDSAVDSQELRAAVQKYMRDNPRSLYCKLRDLPK